VTRKAKIWLIVGIVIVVLLCCCVISIVAFNALGKVFNVDKIMEVSEAPGSPTVTLANYGRVRVGMTYGEVADIFGGPGIKAAQVQVGGDQLEFYVWKAVGGGHATITFEKNRVTEKSQTDLE
jgi:hypothetical protein